MSAGVFSWWFVLCTVAAVNVSAWAISAVTLRRRRPVMSDEGYAARRVQLLLSAGYVFGCAFRSVLPVFDVPRLSLFDSGLSNALVGRSVATVAELCFVGQWAFLLHETAQATGSRFTAKVSRTIVPLISIAEACSWYSVLTTSNLGHVIEESLWGCSAALVVAAMAFSRPRCTPVSRPVLAGWCLAGIGYVTYMFTTDVPMYWSRWMADEARGHQYLSVAQGALDAFHRRVVSYRWDDWQTEIVWMSLYFSVAVWISISLIHAPLPRRWRGANADPPLALPFGSRSV